MRNIFRDWILSRTPLGACVRLLLAVGVFAVAHRLPRTPEFVWSVIRSALGLVAGILAFSAYYHFVLMPLIVVSAWLAIRFGKARASYPCPVCGYDVQATPHRCPECGTKLRWGILDR